MNVVLSETELKYLGLRIGRIETKQIEGIKNLKNKIIELNLDVLRIRVPASYENVNLDLNKLGFPFYFAGGVRRYEVNCKKAPQLPFTNENINFELYNGNEKQKDILFDLIEDSWGQYPIGYYKSPGLEKVVSKKMETNCLFEYYAKHNDNSKYPNSYLWFLKDGLETIGFIALNKYEDKDMIDSTIAGIYKIHQSKSYFPNILRHIRIFCLENDLTYFRCGARNENIFSQKAFESDFMTSTGVEYVYHVIVNPALRDSTK